MGTDGSMVPQMLDEKSLGKTGKDGVRTGSVMTVLPHGGREILEALAGDRHEIGNAGEIPIGVGYFDVTDIGRKRGHGVVDIGATFMPEQDAPADEGVTEIVDAISGCAPRLIQVCPVRSF
jgi:hypothetical protein